MGFTELTIKDLYVTDSDDIPEEFYGIALPKTVLYKRAAGFFSSSALATLGRGLKQFYYNGGNMRLIGKRSIASTFCNQLSSAIIVSHYTQSKKFST